MCRQVLINWFVRACVSMDTDLGLTQAQQAVLVEVLVASVRQASEGPVLAGRTGAKRVRGHPYLLKKPRICKNTQGVRLIVSGDECQGQETSNR